VVVPTYNERDNVGQVKRRLDPVAGSLGGNLWVLFVDDNSPDGTAGEVRALMEGDSNVRLLERKEKEGLGTAYLEGFRYALKNFDPDVVVQMDADLQHPPEVVGPLVRAVVEGADVAIASRRVKGLTLWRRMVSRGASGLSRRILGLKVKDTTTGFRAFRRGAVEALLAHPPRAVGFIFEVESLYILKLFGFTMVEIPFVFVERATGASKMGMGEIWEFFRGVLAIRFRKY
jgi:dolichol-phosphate mannosyltransferase